MKEYNLIFLPLLFVLLILGCKNQSEIIAPVEKSIILEYEIIYGWTGNKVFIKIFNDKSAVKKLDSNEVNISFSGEEKQQIDISLSDFPSYKRIYEPTNGMWIDIDTYELVSKNSSLFDTVSINEPLDSDDIPDTLEKLILILREK